ncbi:MAG: ligand-binding sensor domain-containing protein, partial [Flavobacteriales bacterium]
MIRHLFIIVLCLLSVKSLAQGKYRFNNYTINNGLSQSSVITIIQDNHNALWAGTQDGINRYDGKKFEIFNSDNTPGIESEYIVCSLKDLNGDLWFGTNKGLVYYNFNKEKFKTFLISPLSPGQINSIVEGEDNTLWLTTE